MNNTEITTEKIDSLLQKIKDKNLNYYDLEAYVNRRLQFNEIGVTVPYTGPDNSQIFSGRTSYSLSALNPGTEYGYVYQFEAIGFDRDEKKPSFKKLLEIGKSKGLHFCLKDVIKYLEKSISGNYYNHRIFIPFIDGDGIGVIEKKKDTFLSQNSEREYYNFTDTDWADHVIKSYNSDLILMIFSKNGVTPRAKDIEIISMVEKNSKRIDQLIGNLYGEKGFTNDDLLHEVKRFDILEKLNNDNEFFTSYVKSIKEKKELIVSYSSRSESFSCGNEGRH